MTDKMKEFLEEAAKDDGFLAKIKETKAAEALIALAKEKGFELSLDDVRSSGAIPDDLLEAVTGGFSIKNVGNWQDTLNELQGQAGGEKPDKFF